MNSTIMQTPIRIVDNKTMVALLFISLRMYGSRILDQFIKVYSLRPIRASTGSIEYCCEERE